jgi:hypothetical protein
VKKLQGDLLSACYVCQRNDLKINDIAIGVPLL